MKTLLLMRHAKSSWKDDGLSDHDRPLKKRGRKDTKRMVNILEKNDLFPHMILSSSAARAIETVNIIVENLGYENEILVLDSLYMGEPDDFVEALQNLDNDIDIVMIVAHNPGIEAYLQIIDGEIEAMPTGALGHLVLGIDDWREVNFDTMGDLLGFWTPKSLKDKE